MINLNSDEYRLFLGTYIDKNIVSTFYNSSLENISKLVKGKLVEPWNFHFTWHFFGECTKNDLNDIIACLNPYFKEYESKLLLKGISGFPSKYNPRVLYLELIDENKVLSEIHKEMIESIGKIGFKVDKNKFVPHVTLIRIKEIIDKFALQNFIDKYSNHQFGIQNSFKINLIQSNLTSKGPVYKILK